MIYEKIDLKVDVQKLQDYCRKHVICLQPVMQSTDFGGWSILSYSGSYLDGWQAGHRCYKTREDGTVYWDHEMAEKMGYVPEFEQKNPTELCTEYMLEVMEMIRALNLHPRRARWSLLRAGGQSSLHRDGRDEGYAVRLHIPVFTNPDCVFWVEGEGEIHMPADGSVFLLRVNRMHQIFNRSKKDRIHIIMNVYDKNGVSQHHRYMGP